jgi:hypothetical protein
MPHIVYILIVVIVVIALVYALVNLFHRGPRV